MVNSALMYRSPSRHVQVSHVLAALQAGNRGTQACITAASAVSGIIADLDTTIMFATTGTLNRENAETFADHRYTTHTAIEFESGDEELASPLFVWRV